MRIIFALAFIIFSCTAMAGDSSSDNEVLRNLRTVEKIEQGEFSDKNSATVQALLAFAASKGFNISTIAPQVVSFAEGIEGFAKPKEKVWEIGLQDRATSKTYLYFVNPVTGKVLLRCLNQKGLTNECS